MGQVHESCELTEMPAKLREEVERFQRDHTLMKTEVLDYKKVVSTPYIDKSREVISHEVYLEYGNMLVLITYWEKSFGGNEAVYKNSMNLAQVENFYAKSTYFKGSIEGK